MKRVSNAPLGSGAAAEANGLANVQMNGNESQMNGSQPQGVNAQKLSELLNKIIHSHNKPDPDLLDQVGDYSDQINDFKIKEKLLKIGNALQMANDKRKATRDPETGLTDPDATELAKRLLIHIKPMLKGASAVYNHRFAQQVNKRKKKTRGNPFRVLMGKVGKLLDHGVAKNDIVRYLAKMKYWNKETIERAVEIVRDYNRNQKRDSDNEKATKKETEKLIHETEKEMESHKTSANDSKLVTAAYDYTTKPDFKKRSTGELIFRACFLMDLLESDKNTPQGDFKEPADKKGAKEELKMIKTALVDRGFDKEELSNLGLGL
jgi:vacuolar-type H+-ATPase subunit H